jgi:hypothetical protein
MLVAGQLALQCHDLLSMVLQDGDEAPVVLLLETGDLGLVG